MKVLLEKGRNGEDVLVLRAETAEDYTTLKHLHGIGYRGAKLLLTARFSGIDGERVVSLSYQAERIEPDDLK